MAEYSSITGTKTFNNIKNVNINATNFNVPIGYLKKHKRSYYGPHVIVEEVKKAHRKKCKICGEKPKKTRVIYKEEQSSGFPQSHCYCIEHATDLLYDKIYFLKEILENLEKKDKEIKVEPEDTTWDFLRLEL